MNTTGKIQLRSSKKKLNSAQLSLQRALMEENDDEVMMSQMNEAIDDIRSARSIIDFVMLSYGQEIEEGGI